MCMLALAGWAIVAVAAEPIRLDKARFHDKCRGAWAGQMAGVMFGLPYEWEWGCEGFRFTAEPILEDLEPWKPERIHGALENDDLCIETTFLKALDEHGLDITSRQAGIVFGATTYELWHANLAARENVRRGIMPPDSGHPKHTAHFDDIDFQIESDLFGIISPGLPRESNRLCDIFGHIMCYGDGVYAGMFVAGMYAAAYFENDDVRAVVEAGLACIPEKSIYHQCISDVVRWHEENPGDWLATWRKIEDTWNDNLDCEPQWDASIDAKINGAYAVLGLLYGDGDFARTIELATRCGQDADCNPATAAGVLGCMKGYSGIPQEWVSALEEDAGTKYAKAEYTFDELVSKSQRMAERNILRVGGAIHEDAYMIPRQTPLAPRELEQWTEQAGPSASAKRPEPLFVVALGDSITAAAGQSEAARWTNLLQARLREAVPGRRVRVVNAGVGGNTSKEGLARLADDVLPYRPRVVMVQFGGNDATPEDLRHVPPGEYAATLAEICARLKAAHVSTIVLVTFPPIVDAAHAWSQDAAIQAHGGPDAVVDEYRRITREFAAENHLPLADIDRALRAAMAESRAEEFILPDGVHLTGQGNAVVAEEVYRAVVEGIPELLP